MNSRKTGFLATGAFLVMAGAAMCGWHFADAPAPGKLNVKIETKPTVMTVAYKAYGNAEAADGKYWLSKLVMQNTGEEPLSDLSVSYRIPDHIDWNTPDAAAELLPGQTAVLPIYPRFPSSVTRIRTRTPAQLEVKICYTADGEETEVVHKRPFELRGVTEIEYTSLGSDEIINWFDMWDNSEILAAYMTDEDEVVKAYFGKISETMGGTPYVKSAEDLGKLLGAIYKFQVGTGMVYMGAKGVPEELGDTQTLVQSIKLPREVIRGNSGTCIELTLLMSALLRQCGVKSHMVLIPGHAFPIIEMPTGQLIAFETTGIGGQNLGGTSSFEQAVDKGEKYWKECQEGKMPFVVVDYLSYQAKGIRPPELEPVDITALSQLLATRIPQQQTERVAQPQTVQQAVQPPVQQPVQQVDYKSAPRHVPAPAPNVAVYRDPANMLAVQYPSHWMTDAQELQNVQMGGAPWYLFNAEDAQTGWGVSTFGFGSSDQAACIEALREFGAARGLNMYFGQPQARNINGTHWTVVPISYQNHMGLPFTAELNMHTVGHGTYGVGISGPTQSAQAAQAVVNQIINSIQLNGE